jgi:hypothetical protein
MKETAKTKSADPFQKSARIAGRKHTFGTGRLELLQHASNFSPRATRVGRTAG